MFRSLFRIAFLALTVTQVATSAHSGTLEHIRSRGKLLAGYRGDARPFSYEESGHAEGYSISLCEQVAKSIRGELGLSALPIEWVKVLSDDRFEAIASGKIDLLCGAASDTLERRKHVSFSLPIFLTGVSKLVRPAAAKKAGKSILSAQQGTTAASWLEERGPDLAAESTIVPVASYQEGIDRVIAGTSDALFGDRAILLDTISRSPRAGELEIESRRYTLEPIALASARGDADFQLAVDRALSHLYGSPKFWDIYTIFFGKPDDDARAFFRLAARPD
jgi:polar amino acid transport system substrate-binding protein